ncbi:tetratricopeptide repeat-containing sulfotransferase family protein [Salinisphaera aquimarina]
MVHHRAGRLEAAERCYRALKRRDPGYPEALRMRAVLAHQQGRANAAVKLMRRAIEQQPSNPVYHHSLGELLRALGDANTAITAYRRAFVLQPDRVENGLDLGDTLAQTGRSEDALMVYRALLKARPALGEAHARVAALLFERGAPADAGEQLLAWAQQGTEDVESQRDLAAAWAVIGEYERAVRIHDAIRVSNPEDARAYAGLGSMRQSQGRFDESASFLEQALDVDPGLEWVYAALMNNRDYSMAQARVDAMRQRLKDRSLGDEARSHLHFALGHLHDGCGDTAEAFAHFRDGNRLQARRHPFDPAAFGQRIDRITRHLDTAFFAEHRTSGDPSQRPLFIVGMPRSGTSLVEQIVASHPQAHGAGELSDIGRMVRELPAIVGTPSQRYPECLRRLTAEQVITLSQRYLGALSARDPEAQRVTDKMPFNMLWLGLIARLFPNARVIYCRREAMDNCLSCYFQLFNKGLRFSYDLAHLGRVYRQHERLMAHWAACLPLSMLTVDYESLVDDEELEIRRLIDFTGLPWDDACLRFHESSRAVRTASVWQVRQPVYRSSVARWRAYEPWLGDLRDALAAHAPPTG